MISLAALIIAVVAGLALATIGSPGLASAVAASLLMGSTVAVITFVLLQRIAPRRTRVDGAPRRQAQVVSTAIPDLDDHDEAMLAAAAAWDSRPDPFAVRWQEAERDPATGRNELRAWEDWTSTLSEESAVAPTWTDEPRGMSFDFKRWLPPVADHDTVQLSVAKAEPASQRAASLESAPPPSVDLRVPGFPDFAPWPDAPWRIASGSTDRVDA